ncbi:hypothetical protein VTK26DRAFT_4847 [Humicola hyalothermophila]
MSRYSISRLLALDVARPLSKTPSAIASAPQWTRLFSQSHVTRKDQVPPREPMPQAGAESPMERLGRATLRGAAAGASPRGYSSAEMEEELNVPEQVVNQEPYHFHIYSHKHNTHITLTKPNRDALLSLSCGNLGFKKSNRKHYDSAYQLGAYFIDKMYQKNLVKDIHSLEVVLRGFGPGREAVVKVLMGNEGKQLRPKITRVSDATRLKFGGTRSPRIRRLG